METEILKLASSQGIWAALSVVLIFYILKAQEKRDLKQEQREENYQRIIKNLTDNLHLIEDVKKDVKEVKDVLLRTS
ncbi:phage-like protein [Clostridium botulinum]|uniref:Phage-like protein n=4 Tax=Clostridium botulinum TaxID=1491 RepID=A0A9Q1ZAF1_CLOBO|nr:BhlA/UviB family holin-like peptide [Clostridium botulinum]AEB77594.1 hypothetical protein CbC4_6073 [Clostridium botulinum BKT015925]KEH95990.1 hypothetical protein Y848_p0166 [Clostridium botulinum C/D str. Sp77]KEH96745.1 hypothetical protein Z953_14080 [Clostridium botulinum D str. 16868]KEH96894.1 hypothetical protein Z953_13610 [Clostridium botulinum D str. 16868]KLU74581.1 phage-like protein [Clostridium botulinum V891]